MKEPTQKKLISYQFGTSKCGVEIYVHPIERVYVRNEAKAKACLDALNNLSNHETAFIREENH